MATSGPFGGSANPAAEIFRGIAAGMQERNARELVTALKQRDDLVKKFEEAENDETYDPQAREQARNHAISLRMIPPTKPLPKEYQPDKNKNGIPPALFDVYYRKLMKTGPGEVKEPAQPADPSAGLAPPPNFDDLLAQGHGAAPAGSNFEGAAAAGHGGGAGPVGPADMMARAESPMAGPAPGSAALPQPAGIEPPPIDLAEFQSTRMTPEQMALDKTGVQISVENKKRDAMVAELRKYKVPEEVIQRVLVDSISGVTLPSESKRMLAPQKLAVRGPDNKVTEVRATWNGETFLDAMTLKPVAGTIVGTPRWLDVGDKLIAVDSTNGQPLGMEADKKVFRIDPISGDIVSITGNSGFRNTGAPPAAVAPAATPAPTADPSKTATPPAAGIPPPPAVDGAAPVDGAVSATADTAGGPDLIMQRLPGRDDVSVRARGIYNGNEKFESLQTNALRNKVSDALEKAGVLLLNDKEQAGLEVGLRVRGLTKDMRDFVERIKADPFDREAQQELNRTVESIRGIFAKGTFQESGVLTDRDIERAGALLPGGKTTALRELTPEAIANWFSLDPDKKLDELEKILRRGLTVKFRGRKGDLIQKFGRRDEVLPVLTREKAAEYRQRAGGDIQKARRMAIEDGWEIPAASAPRQ